MGGGLPGSRNLTSPPPGYSPERSGTAAEARYSLEISLERLSCLLYRGSVYRAWDYRGLGVFIEPGVMGSLR